MSRFCMYQMVLCAPQSQLDRYKVEGGIPKFVSSLTEKHGIDMGERFLQELRKLGKDVMVLPEKLRARARGLPVTTAIKALRSSDPEAAIGL